MNYEEGQALRALKMTAQMAREDCLRAMYLFNVKTATMIEGKQFLPRTGHVVP